MRELSFQWGAIQSFYWLIVLVILTAIYFYFEKKSIQKLQKAFGTKVSDYLTQSVSYLKRRQQFLLQLISLVCIVVALARPQAGQSQQEIKSEGIELMILADVSESMLAQDVKPSRLAQMKVELNKLIETMPGHKIGLIAFAGSSALQSPLTSDPGALKMYIDALDVNSVSEQGTNFESALSYAREAFQKGGVTQDQMTKTTRVVLVVSDGEDQEAGALEAAKKLAQSGVRIFSVAYGTEKGGAIPVRDRVGNEIGFKKDDSGQTVITQVKGEFLKQLAQAGEGHFYFSQTNGEHLKNIAADVNQLEKAQFQSKLMTQYEEKFTLPLFLGLIGLMLSLLMTDANKKALNWNGRYETNT